MEEDRIPPDSMIEPSFLDERRLLPDPTIVMIKLHFRNEIRSLPHSMIPIMIEQSFLDARRSLLDPMIVIMIEPSYMEKPSCFFW